MAGFSDVWENELLDHTLRNEAAPAVPNVYVSLHSSDPGETGANELVGTGNGYLRASGAFSSASAGASANTNLLAWTNLPSGNISHCGLWNASGNGAGNGTFLGGGAFSQTRNVFGGDGFNVAIGDLDVTLD